MNLLSFCLFGLLSPFLYSAVSALPLYTNSRWIVNERGQRVKLACVNWPSHLEPVLAEGLIKQPLDSISKRIVSMGFNCVRLTWPLFLATNNSLASMSVSQSFRGLGLAEPLGGIQQNNPSFLNLSLIDAFKAVVSNLASNHLWVILDNHITKPGWCCSNTDGNGFFGDEYFDPSLWVDGLRQMAMTFRTEPNVVALSLRNELRGQRQNVQDWFKYMQQGAEAVHSANPDVLVIISGFNFDTDLSFLEHQAMNLTFDMKLVYEIHRYSFTNGAVWSDKNANTACRIVSDEVMRRAGFLLEKGHPLFVSEFGGDLTGNNINDNRFLSCFFGLVAELDIDWAWWTLIGSYYSRDGKVGAEEVYGLLTPDFSRPRNLSFVQRISSLQTPFQVPDSSEPIHVVIFHPQTGLCVQYNSGQAALVLGPCGRAQTWNYTAIKSLLTEGTNSCLQADEPGQPAKLGNVCTDPSSIWQSISDSQMHLSSKVGNDTVCLDIDSSNTIVTGSCKCLSADNTCDPTSQWFKLVSSSRASIRKRKL